jgi:hypothetical protein
MNGIFRDIQSRDASLRARGRFLPWISGMVFLFVAAGCAHYPINQPLRQYEHLRLMIQDVKEQRLRANRVGYQNAILKVRN